jgi:hypothetical protein
MLTKQERFRGCLLGGAIDAIAIDLVFSERVSSPDARFLASAIHSDADLWYSHRHRDGIVEAAERLRPKRVFVLTESKFQT